MVAVLTSQSATEFNVVVKTPVVAYTVQSDAAVNVAVPATARFFHKSVDVPSIVPNNL